MSREIKFRAWDATTGEMLSVDDFSELLSGPGITYLSDYFENPDYTPLQYTGLKDKNGVEIYEGDVIVQYLYRGDEKPMKGRGVITFDRGSFMMTGRYAPLRDADRERLEVIGNTYEQPELVKGVA